jgi:hypothetical protein
MAFCGTILTRWNWFNNVSLSADVRVVNFDGYLTYWISSPISRLTIQAKKHQNLGSRSGGIAFCGTILARWNWFNNVSLSADVCVVNCDGYLTYWISSPISRLTIQAKKHQNPRSRSGGMAFCGTILARWNWFNNVSLSADVCVINCDGCLTYWISSAISRLTIQAKKHQNLGSRSGGIAFCGTILARWNWFTKVSF